MHNLAHNLARRPLYAVVLAIFLMSTAACFYSFRGGGLPPHIKTVTVVPFENETAVADVQREISDSLRSKLIKRLGVREAPESRANAVVRGTIRQYQTDIPVGVNAGTRAATTARRTVQIVLDIDVTDQVNGKTLWSRKGFVVEGQYEEGSELQGRSQAIDRIVNGIVEGVQSQW